MPRPWLQNNTCLVYFKCTRGLEAPRSMRLNNLCVYALGNRARITVAATWHDLCHERVGRLNQLTSERTLPVRLCHCIHAAL